MAVGWRRFGEEGRGDFGVGNLAALLLYARERAGQCYGDAQGGVWQSAEWPTDNHIDRQTIKQKNEAGRDRQRNMHTY